MSSSLFRKAGAVVAMACIVTAGWSADTAGKSAGSTGSRAGSARGVTAKGPLPDPVLLDGSTFQAEKKSEHGMIGDFELPGDENARSGKVGGPPGQPGGQGGRQGQPPGVSVALPMPQLPGATGAGGASSPAGLNLPDPTKQGGSGDGAAAGDTPAGGAQGAQAKDGGAAGQPGAKAEGIQVGGLQGEGGADAGATPSGKPSPVVIGDSAMRIETSPAAAAAIGQNQQVAGHTQQHEKGTGSGGKGSGGASSGNRVEKGRVIPSGL